LEERRELLAGARKVEAEGNEALGAWQRTFAANLGLMASDDPAERERGARMLKRNADRFERDVLHLEIGAYLRGETSLVVGSK
jgi:hypothetical protein